MKQLLIASLLLILCGCATRYIPGPTTTIHDSVYVNVDVIKYDTIVLYKIKHDSVKEVVTLQDTSLLETDLAWSSAWIGTKGLNHILKNKEGNINVPIEITDSIKTVTKIKYVEKTVPYPVEKQLSWYQKTMIKLGWLSIGLIILGSVYFVLKSKIKL